jgi:hypothetical protein
MALRLVRWQRKCDLQRSIQLLLFRLAQLTYKIRQTRFFKTHQAVTMNGAIVFQAFFDAHIDLSGQSMPFGKDGSTDDGRVVGINKRLSTGDHE